MMVSDVFIICHQFRQDRRNHTALQLRSGLELIINSESNRGLSLRGEAVEVLLGQ